MNTKRDRFETGSESKRIFKIFSKCKAKDIKCGRLLCENIQRLPLIEKHQTLTQFPMQDTWCWGAVFLHHRRDDKELKDGIPDQIFLLINEALQSRNLSHKVQILLIHSFICSINIFSSYCQVEPCKIDDIRSLSPTKMASSYGST